MAERDLPSNSKKSKEDASKVEVVVQPAAKAEKPERFERITTEDAVVRKPSLGRRIASAFTGDDAKTVGDYVFFEVMLPAVKTMLSDTVTAAVERMLFGSTARSSTRAGKSSGGYTPYSRMFNGGGSSSAPQKPEFTRSDRANHNFDAIILPSRGEAERIIDTLQDIIVNFDVASVADLYDLVGITGEFTDDKWGWTGDLGGWPKAVRGGYQLMLPKPSPID